MSDTEQLRKQRYQTVINDISKGQEKDCRKAIEQLADFLRKEHHVKLAMENQLHLK